MEKSEGWVGRILYVFFVGNNRPNGEPIERTVITDCLTELFEQLKQRLGGVTTMEPFQATGNTLDWIPEPTTVVLILAEVSKETIADLHIASQGQKLAKALTQDQVWITKQSLDLYISTSTN